MQRTIQKLEVHREAVVAFVTAAAAVLEAQQEMQTLLRVLGAAYSELADACEGLPAAAADEAREVKTCLSGGDGVGRCWLRQAEECFRERVSPTAAETCAAGAALSQRLRALRKEKHRLIRAAKARAAEDATSEGADAQGETAAAMRRLREGATGAAADYQAYWETSFSVGGPETAGTAMLMRICHAARAQLEAVCAAGRIIFEGDLPTPTGSESLSSSALSSLLSMDPLHWDTDAARAPTAVRAPTLPDLSSLAFPVTAPAAALPAAALVPTPPASPDALLLGPQRNSYPLGVAGKKTLLPMLPPSTAAAAASGHPLSPDVSAESSISGRYAPVVRAPAPSSSASAASSAVLRYCRSPAPPPPLAGAAAPRPSPRPRPLHRQPKRFGPANSVVSTLPLLRDPAAAFLYNAETGETEMFN